MLLCPAWYVVRSEVSPSSLQNRRESLAHSCRSCRVLRNLPSIRNALTILTDVALSLVWAKVGGVAGLNVVAGPILLALCGLRLG
jgi:hypothetical protein